jgi:hypothetical protein
MSECASDVEHERGVVAVRVAGSLRRERLRNGFIPVVRERVRFSTVQVSIFLDRSFAPSQVVSASLLDFVFPLREIAHDCALRQHDRLCSYFLEETSF